MNIYSHQSRRNYFIIKKQLLPEIFASFIFGLVLYSTQITLDFYSKIVFLIIITVCVISVIFLDTVADFCIIQSHINPMVTIATVVAGYVPLENGLGYVMSQMTGFLLAKAVTKIVLSNKHFSRKIKITFLNENVPNFLVFEFMCTMMITLIALSTGVMKYNNEHQGRKNYLKRNIEHILIGLLLLWSVFHSKGMICNLGNCMVAFGLLLDEREPGLSISIIFVEILGALASGLLYRNLWT